jgi:peptidoglycan/xylan/chitin deacetylase (PgdA/CDA1 family)
MSGFTAIKKTILHLGWGFPHARLFASRLPTMLLYHGLPKHGNDGGIDVDAFESQICFLKEQFEVVHLSREMELRKRTQRPRAILTFDDGFRNNADVVIPILRRHSIPATLFISSYHSVPGKYLWFVYLRALFKHFPEDGFWFRGDYMDMSMSKRDATGRRIWDQLLALPNHPREMYEAIENELPKLEDFMSSELLQDGCAGMTSEQVREIAQDPLFSIGIHTDSHPFLSKCDPIESYRQIAENKRWLEDASGRHCDIIAYPIGDYDERIIQQCVELGIRRGYAVIPSLQRYPDFEVPRVGVYSPSLDVLGVKVQWGRVIRQLRISVG